jgi:hypothetical protein
LHGSSVRSDQLIVNSIFFRLKGPSKWAASFSYGSQV